MTSWRFSWRAVGAAVGAALAAGVFFGVALSLLDVSVSPQEWDGFLSQAGVLAVAAALVLLVLGGVLMLLASLVARRLSWPRPWLEAVILAAVCFALTASEDVLTINITGAAGPLPPNHIVMILAGHVVPTATGFLFPVVYWLLAKPNVAA